MQKLISFVLISFVFLQLSCFSKGKHPNNEELVSRYFDRIKSQGDPFLINFFSSFPKGADLHIHLPGAISPYQWLLKAQKHKLFYSIDSHQISDQAAKGFSPISMIKGNFEWESLYDQLSLRDNMNHDHFFQTIIFLKSLMTFIPIEECFPSFLENAISENIDYIEVLIGPHLFPKQFNRNFFLNDFRNAKKVLKPDVEKFCKNAQQFFDNCDQYSSHLIEKNASIYDTNSPVCIRWIVDISRGTEDLHKFYFHILAALNLVKKDPRVVSINISGLEASPYATENLTAHLQIINDLSNHFSQKITLHAGEINLKNGLGNVHLQHRISSVLEMVSTIQRIGHCSSLFWDTNSDVILNLQKQNITLEICPTSNEIILQLSGKNHPIHFFLQNSLPIVICTDDPGVNSSCLTFEFTKVANWTKEYLTYINFKQFAIHSLEVSFLKGKGIYKWTSKGYQRKKSFRQLSPCSEEMKTLLHNSEKAQIEYRHALKLEEFERKILKKAKL